MNQYQQELIKIAVSSCLTGQAVRYDGSHKSQDIIQDLHSNHFNIVTICPEVAIKLGVPREPIIILEQPSGSGHYQLLQKTDYTVNHSEKMSSYANHCIDSMFDICGYIVKERSPSCGYRETPRFSVDNLGVTTRLNTNNYKGFFIEKIVQALPYLPIISEPLLIQSVEHDNFIERVFILHLWQKNLNSNNTLDFFYQQIKHQLAIRNYSGFRNLIKNYRDLTIDTDSDFITEIMTIMKEAVTFEMNYQFLKNFIKHHKLNSNDINSMLTQYKNKQISLSDVINRLRNKFQDIISKQSNYFYPVLQEFKMRGNFFE